MRQISLIAISLLFSLAACDHRMEIESGIILDATSWNVAANAPPAVPEFSGIASNGDIAAAYEVSPGSVLYISTPTFGSALSARDYGIAHGDVPLYVGLRQPQLAAPLRLPIRRVHPAGRLTVDERYFLATVLSLHRTKAFGNTDDAQQQGYAETLHGALIKHEVALWNAAIAAMRVRLVEGPVAGQPRRDIALTVDRKALCEGLPADAKTSLGSAFRTLICPERGIKENVELFARQSATRVDIWRSLVSHADSPREAQGFYGSANESPRVNAASIIGFELNGVLPRGERSESRWTLLEWQNAGVCPVGLRIHTVRFAHGRRFLILYGERAASANHKITVDLTPGKASVRIEPSRTDGGAAGFTSTLSEDSLRWIRGRDTSEIEWADVDGNRASCRGGE